MFWRSFIYTLNVLLLLASTGQAEVGVTWSGVYNGRYYKPKVYTRSNMCCRNPNCGMYQQIASLISKAEQETTSKIPRLAETTSEVPRLAKQSVSDGESYEVQVPYEVEEPYQVRVCTTDWRGRKSCKLVTRYRTVTKYRTETRYRKPEPTKAPDLDAMTIVEVSPEDLVLKLRPTPMRAVKALLAELQPQPGELVVDLGCGDGRFVIEAVKAYGCKGRGIELNTETAAKASDAAKGVLGVEIIAGDIMTEEWQDADIVVMYLYEDLIAEVWPKIPDGTLVASVNHRLPGICRKVDREGHSFYIAIKR